MCNASPISDLNPLLMAAAGAHINIASLNSSRSVPINADFFTGYKKTLLDSDEVLISLLLPFTTEVLIINQQLNNNYNDNVTSIS